TSWRGDGVAGEPSLVAAVGGEEAWRRYWDSLEHAARSGLFDTLGHPDLVKMYGDELHWDWSSVVGGLDGVCLEVSCAGLHKRHGNLYTKRQPVARCDL